MTVIGVDSEGHAACVRRLRAAGDGIAEALRTLESDSAVLRSAWSGEAQLAFDRAQQAWGSSVREMTTTLTAIADATVAAGEHLMNADRDVAALWTRA